MKIKLPWELSTIYSEYLGGPGGDGREEEDEDDIEAHADSLQRLKDADEATRRMTRDEYVHYSECRQASFTFKKSKKFREFINAGAYVDNKPNDDIIDILGFLAFEVVRELCVGAVALKQSLEEENAHIKRLTDGSKNRKNFIENGGSVAEVSGGTAVDEDSNHQEQNGKAQSDSASVDASTKVSNLEGNEKPSTNGSSTAMKRKLTSTSMHESMSSKKLATSANTKREQSPSSSILSSCGLFAMPPAKASPLMTSHVREAFARLQRNRVALSTATGGVPGGLKRTRVFVI
jgi:transcription initiation protein SPT3